jgi:hypothetical protein
MKTGYDTQLTRQIGEHLVVAKLGRLGVIATPFAGNVPDFDLLASDLSGHSFPVQVKAINGFSWQFSATKFLDIEFVGDKQIVRGKKKLTNPTLICVLVLLDSNENDKFFIMKLKNLQDYFFKNYKGGVRPKNPKSTHCAIQPKELKKYEDNWKLIMNNFGFKKG